MTATYEGARGATSAPGTIPLRLRDERASSSRMTRTCPEQPRPGSGPRHVRTCHVQCQTLRGWVPDQARQRRGQLGRADRRVPRPGACASRPSRQAMWPERPHRQVARAQATRPRPLRPAVGGSPGAGGRFIRPGGHTSRPSQPLRRRRRLVGEPWVSPRVYSYWRADSTSSFAARRAGSTAARIPAATATAVKATSDPTGSANSTP
jgi:hypothetical protein